jgi:5-methylcytosine-specific restriction protein A
MVHTSFVVGDTYNRSDILRLAGIADLPDADIFADVHQYGDDWIIFSTMDPSDEGGDRFVDGQFVWQPSSDRMTAPHKVQALAYTPGRVSIFMRTDDREPYTFLGYGQPSGVSEADPAHIIWDLRDEPLMVMPLADEVLGVSEVTEGAVVRVAVNKYERSAFARKVCLEHFGAVCAVCDLRFEVIYGPMGRGYIHVHHLMPLSSIGKEYVVDPVRHLRPVCPNCHAMLHMEDPPITIEKLRSIVEKSRSSS